MNTVLVVVADRRAARLLEGRAGGPGLRPLAELENAGLGQHERDLVSARAGRVRNPGTRGPQTLAPPTPARTRAIDVFARTVARRAGGLLSAQRHDALVLVAEPKVLGAIRASLSKAARQRLRATLAKDVMHLAAKALAAEIEPLVQQALRDVARARVLAS